MVKVAVIGCGKIAQVRHIPEYSDHPAAVLAGFYDLNFQRAKELADNYGGKAYRTVEDIMADPEIGAISVCTANSTHAEIAIEAMKAGKHVLCEKPMAMSVDDCERMVRVSKETNRILMIDQNQRLTAAHQKARQMIAEGELGEVITFRTTFGHSGPETWSIDANQGVWFFDKTKAVMGAMADLGIHKTDLIQYLLGQQVVETTAKVMTLQKRYADGEKIGVDDNAICLYTMSGGAVGTMTASWTYYGPEDNSTIIYGTKGILRIYDDPKYAMTWNTPDGETRYYDLEKIQTNDNQTKSGVIDEFIRCITEDKKPEISGESVLPAMRAVFASLEASDAGRSVRVQEAQKERR